MRKSLKNSIAIGLAAIAVGLAGCTFKAGDAVETTEQTSCSQEQTVPKSRYDEMLQSYHRRGTADLSQLSDAELEKYSDESAEMIRLFKDGKKVCVVDNAGRSSIYTWDQKALTAEALRYLRLRILLGGQGRGDGSGAIEPPVPGTEPSAVPAQPFRAAANDLRAFIQGKVHGAMDAGDFEIDIVSASTFSARSNNDREGLSNEEALSRLKAYYRQNASQMEEPVVSFLESYAKNFSSIHSDAKMKFAGDEPSLKPVLKYFLEKYGEDLSRVVVIAASITSIPHAAGTAFEGSLGLFISPIETPAQIEFRLPARKIDSRAEDGAYYTGRLSVKLRQQQALQLSVLHFAYGSDHLIHLDPKMISDKRGGSLAFEAVAAHEFRHMLDFFNCSAATAEICDREKLQKDWNETVHRANDQLDSYYTRFTADPDTQKSKRELVRLYARSNPLGTDSSQEKWADDALLRIFNSNYKFYPSYYSIIEQRGYKEQLRYLMAHSLTPGQAIRLALQTARGENIPVSINGKTEHVSWPAFPWVEDLFTRLANTN